VVRGVIRRKDVSSLDGMCTGCCTVEVTSIVSDVSGREFAEFGTVRPRVQIPGPPTSLRVHICVTEFELGSNSRASRFCAMRGGALLIAHKHVVRRLPQHFMLQVPTAAHGWVDELAS
jgi:hypothetical protein